MARKSIGIRPIPTWVRGPAFIDGGEIGLAEGEFETYQAFTPEHSERILFDLPQLALLDFDGDKLTIDYKRSLAFAEEHGLIWHGSDHAGKGEFREPLSAWWLAACELQLTVTLYSKLKESLEGENADPIRNYLRSLRDEGVFKRSKRLLLSNDDDALREFASDQLSERITRGMEDCTPTLLAGCRLINEEGAKVGAAGDFYFGNDPGSLFGAANYALASLISRKEVFLDCEGCGRMFRPNHGHQRFCEERCYERHRKRLQRESRRVASPPS